MDGILRNEKDDVSQDYLVSRQVAHEYHSPSVQGFINRFSQMIQETPKDVISKEQYVRSQTKEPAIDTGEVTPGEKPDEFLMQERQKATGELEQQTGGLEEPFLDPTTAAAGGFAGAGVTSLNQGMKLMPSLGRAVLSGVVGGIADYPIGAATEVVEEKAPSLALPFNVITGLVSGVTLESAIERGVVKALGKAADSDTIRRVVADSKKWLEGTLESLDENVSKPVINSLNETINNEIGAVGDINQVKAKLQKAGLTGKELETKAQEVLSAKLEGPAPSEKYVGNINIERLDTTDKIKNLLNLNTEQFKTQFFESRRGVRTWEETEKAAKKYTLEDLLGREPGQAFNAEQSLNARVLQVTSAENLQGMTEKIRTGNASDNDKLEFMQAFGLHYAIMNQVAGITAEAGRTLNIFRKMAGGGDIKQVQEIMKNMPASPEELAEALSTMDSPVGVNKLVKGAMRATTKDMFLEAWINGLLSGPQTHMVNSLSNALNAVWQVPERFLAGMLGRVLPGEQVIKETEALQQAYGLVEGFKDGIKAFGKVVRTGATEDELTKLEAARYKAITAENVRQLPMIKKLAPNALQEGGVAARAVDFMGETIRTPGRFLMAEDELFKSIGYRMELRAQAFRMATQEGLEGDALANRMAEILQDPEKLAPNVHLAAVDAARYQTFTSPLESKLLGALSQSKNPVIKLIVPFVRTPTNILKYAFERTPFAAMSSKVRADISAGGARRDLALARISMGSMLMSAAAIMAAEGKITGGGPSDPKLSANLRRQGWQPYSIKIGDKYVQYGRLEPLGMIFGLAADFSEITGLAGDELSPESENLASAIVMAVSRNVTSKTWLRGISETVQAMDDPDRYGNRYIQNYARSLVPSIVAQAERSIDPELEAVYSLSDSIKSRIPGYSDDLPPRRDLWGDPVTTQISTGKRSWGEVAYSTISPIYISEGKSSPIDKELTRMKIGLSKPGKKQSIMGVPMELTPKLYDEFIQISTKKVINGKDLKDFLNDFVKNPDYKQMSDDRKEEEVRNIMTKARNIARMKMVEKYPQLRDVAIAWKQRLAQ